MIPGTNYAAFYDTDSLERISGFRGMLWQPFYPLFCKGTKSK